MVLDPITVQVIGSLVLSISEEMGATLMKTAYSPNIKERADRSTAIFDPRGQVIAQAQLIPMHLGSMIGAVDELIKRHPAHTMKPGDMFMANDPYSGGGHHLPDLNLIAPVFFQDGLVAYVASLGHHSDVGGMVAGSEAADCKEIYQEGLRLPPVRLVRAGEVDEDIMNIILLNTRTPRDRLGDIRAQIAANRVGIRGVLEVYERYGKEMVAAAMEEQLSYGEKRIRSSIEKIPDGVYEAVDYLDNDGFTECPVKIQLAMTIEGDRLKLDFTGTDPQMPSSRNVPIGALKATVFTVIKSMLDPGLPANGGYYRAIEVIAPPGCLLNPQHPAAVGQRALSCIVAGDTVVSALSQAMPAGAMASSGPHHHIIPSGANPRTGEFFVDYETFAGAYGARAYHDGLDGVRVHASGAANLPVESLEINFPLRVERYELIQDSGGAGKFRGGLSIRRDYRILAGGVTTVVCGERQRQVAKGLEGGRPGRGGRFLLNPGTPREKMLPSTASDYPLGRDDLLRIETPGGGGYGDPRQRDQTSVRRDLEEGRISPQAGRDEYGLQ